MKTLIVGASTNPERYSFKAALSLLAHGHEIELVGQNEGEIEGHKIQTNYPDLEGIDTVTATRLIRLYGSNIEHYVAELHHIDERIAANGLPKWLKAQLQYTIKHEFVCKPEDFIIRRTADFYFRQRDSSWPRCKN